MSAPAASWCDPAGERLAQVKGSVLLGSECCVATGDSGCEAATADTRAADRTADKTQTPTAASEAPSADSHVPTEATASAATTTAWTGFCCVGDRGNCEEQDRGCGNASDQASLGGGGCR